MYAPGGGVAVGQGRGRLAGRLGNTTRGFESLPSPQHFNCR